MTQIDRAVEQVDKQSNTLAGTQLNNTMRPRDFDEMRHKMRMEDKWTEEWRESASTNTIVKMVNKYWMRSKQSIDMWDNIKG